MSLSNTIDCHYLASKPLDEQKKSRLIAGLLLIGVVLLHILVSQFLLKTLQTDQKVPPTVVMEVVMVSKPVPVVKQQAKEPPPAPPIKKPENKPKPIVKPSKPIIKPAKSVSIKKPVPTLPDLKEIIEIPKFVPTPVVRSAPTVIAPVAKSTSPAPVASAKMTAKAAGQGQDDSKTVVSGVVPILRVPPKYPARAMNRQIEGWVKVEFTIRTDGSVTDAVVVSAEPESIFNEAALTAISKWKFKEKMVNGVAVTQRAVQKLQFKLSQ